LVTTAAGPCRRSPWPAPCQCDRIGGGAHRDADAGVLEVGDHERAGRGGPAVAGVDDQAHGERAAAWLDPGAVGCAHVARCGEQAVGRGQVGRVGIGAGRGRERGGGCRSRPGRARSAGPGSKARTGRRCGSGGHDAPEDQPTTLLTRAWRSTAWAMAWRTPMAAVAGAVVENSSWTIDEEIFWPVWARVRGEARSAPLRYTSWVGPLGPCRAGRGWPPVPGSRRCGSRAGRGRRGSPTTSGWRTMVIWLGTRREHEGPRRGRCRSIAAHDGFSRPFP